MKSKEVTKVVLEEEHNPTYAVMVEASVHSDGYVFLTSYERVGDQTYTKIFTLRPEHSAKLRDALVDNFIAERS